MARSDYRWWRARLQRALAQTDVVRLDHFRAFAAHWELPPGAPSARLGEWKPGPGQPFFDQIKARLGALPLCAEDLGTIDDDVIALREALGFPGMCILHYAFGEDDNNPHLPHNQKQNTVVYPGNHDNDTTHGWWQTLAPESRTHAQHYLGRHGEDIAWDLNRLALASPANLAVIQMQDILSLGSDGRMNDPGSYTAPPSEWRNWRWRLTPGQASGFAAERLRQLGGLYSRIAAG